MCATTFRSCSNILAAPQQFTTLEGETKAMETFDDDAPSDEKSQRLDKWLWFARLARTRSLAARLCSESRVSIGGHDAEMHFVGLRHDGPSKYEPA